MHEEACNYHNTKLHRLIILKLKNYVLKTINVIYSVAVDIYNMLK